MREEAQKEEKDDEDYRSKVRAGCDDGNVDGSGSGSGGDGDGGGGLDR